MCELPRISSRVTWRASRPASLARIMSSDVHLELVASTPSLLVERCAAATIGINLDAVSGANMVSSAGSIRSSVDGGVVVDTSANNEPIECSEELHEHTRVARAPTTGRSGLSASLPPRVAPAPSSMLQRWASSLSHGFTWT